MRRETCSHCYPEAGATTPIRIPYTAYSVSLNAIFAPCGLCTNTSLHLLMEKCEPIHFYIISEL